MRYQVLASDYDGTLATGGKVAQAGLEALDRLVASGRKVILVTGRELPDLLDVFPEVERFHRVIAENGGLLYNPETHEGKPLTEPPPPAFVEALRARGVAPLSVGRTIIATWEPHETTVVQVIRDLGLEYQVIFNKGAVMVLPSGVNKGTGLKAALAELRLSAHNVIGIGDAENDHAFLSICEVSVAVANALPMLKERADWVTRGTHEAGVTEVVDQVLTDDLREMEHRFTRHRLLIGEDAHGEHIAVSPHGTRILLAGPSGSGKSTFALGLLERLDQADYQYCLVDPEGDYEGLDGAVTVGDTRRPPTVDEVMQVLRDPRENAIVSLVGLPLHDRPGFFAGLIPRLQELRNQFGRPHWLIVDEAHHLVPAAREGAAPTLPEDLGAVLITVHPDWVATPALASVNAVIAVGTSPTETLHGFCGAAGCDAPAAPVPAPERREVIVWFPGAGAAPRRMKIVPARIEHQRHRRKYAAGDLGTEFSFYFRGPEGKLNLRAQNLTLFLQIAEGIDEETWLHHLRAGDYSRWFRDNIKDDELATEAAAIEQDASLSAQESRDRIRAAVQDRYTGPA
jgi:hydroxymethylpyrimidine pyrophosphatase-like HAD family hydrolase